MKNTKIEEHKYTKKKVEYNMPKTIMNADPDLSFQIECSTSMYLNEKLQYNRLHSNGSISSLSSSMSQLTSSTCTTSFDSETTEDEAWEANHYPSNSNLDVTKDLQDNRNDPNGNESVVTTHYNKEHIRFLKTYETIDDRQEHDEYYYDEKEDDDTITVVEFQSEKEENNNQDSLSASKFNMDEIKSHIHMAAINHEMNEVKLAITHYKEAIRIFEKHEDELEENSQGWESYATTLCQLGILYNTLKKPKHALLLYEKAIEVLSKYKGNLSHTMYPEIWYHMGFAYKEVGMNNEAYMFHFKQNIFEKENENGYVHKLHKLRESIPLLELKSDSEKVKIMNEICILFIEKKEYREALYCCDEAYKMYSKKVEASIQDIITTHMNMGDVFNAFHKIDDAIECYAKALEMKYTNDTSKEDWKERAELLYKIGASYWKQKLLEKADQYLQDFLSSFVNMDLTDSNYPSILLKKSNAFIYLGDIKSQMCLYKDAIKYYQESLKVRLILHGENSKEYFEANCNLGIAYFQDKNFDLAQSTFSNLLSKDEKNKPQGMDNAMVLYELGKIDMAKQKFKDALVKFKESLHIKQDILEDENDNDILKTWHSVALAESYLRNYPQAISILLDIQQRYRSKIGDCHPLNAKIHLDAAKIYIHLNQIDKAEQHCLNAIKGFNLANFPSQHPYLQYSRKFFQKVLSRKEKMKNSSTKEDECCEIYLV